MHWRRPGALVIIHANHGTKCTNHLALRTFRIAIVRYDEGRYILSTPATGVMVRSMRLFLIRHGETVDNVAHL